MERWFGPHHRSVVEKGTWCRVVKQEIQQERHPRIFSEDGVRVRLLHGEETEANHHLILSHGESNCCLLNRG